MCTQAVNYRNSEAEARILSFFQIKKAPPHIGEYLQSKSNGETVLAMPRETALQIASRGIQEGLSFQAIPLDRAQGEYYSDAVQIIAVACIHDDEEVFLLALKNDTRIDGYTKGSLTYPQGHCVFDRDVVKKCIINEKNERILYLNPFIDILKENTFREVSEELESADDYKGYSFWYAVADKIKYANPFRDIYPVYIDRPGSMCKHIGFVFDVAFPGKAFLNEYLGVAKSKEPDKHELIVADMMCMLNSVDRADKICPWVAQTFSRIPFFQSTFLDYYKKIHYTDAGKIVGC